MVTDFHGASPIKPTLQTNRSPASVNVAAATQHRILVQTGGVLFEKRHGPLASRLSDDQFELPPPLLAPARAANTASRLHRYPQKPMQANDARLLHRRYVRAAASAPLSC